jgi:hypothetical protein
MQTPAEFSKQYDFGEYSIEKLEAVHYPLLKKLFLNAFNSKISENEIRKRFDTAMLGLPAIGFIAIHKPTNTPAAYYGVFPCKALIKGREIQIAQSGDTMTHKDHRRKGLFVELARLTYHECEKLGIKVIIGQPNQYSYHGLVKSLRWKHLDDIARWDMKLELKTFPLPKLFRFLGFLSQVYLWYAKFVLKSSIIKDVSSFNNPYKNGFGKIVRDRNYLQYKKSNDKFFIKIDGVIIWIRLTDVLWIGDFDSYENITPDILRKLRQLAYRLGYNTISFNFNESIPLPPSLQLFKKYNSQASCFYYLNDGLNGLNFILTAADSDTW